MKKSLMGIIFCLFLFCIISCVSTKTTEINMEDYGVFDWPEDWKVFSVSSDGEVDSLIYYSETNYNEWTRTTKTSVKKQSSLQQTTREKIRKDCLKAACKKSYELGYEYILIWQDEGKDYESGNTIRYNYQIVFSPIYKENISEELREYQIYRNELYYTPSSQN